MARAGRQSGRAVWTPVDTKPEARTWKPASWSTWEGSHAEAPDRPRPKGQGRSQQQRRRTQPAGGSEVNQSSTAWVAYERGQEVEGKVASIAPHGAYVDIGDSVTAFLPWRNCTLDESAVSPGSVLQKLAVDKVEEAPYRVRLRGPFDICDAQQPWGKWSEDPDQHAEAYVEHKDLLEQEEFERRQQELQQQRETWEKENADLSKEPEQEWTDCGWWSSTHQTGGWNETNTDESWQEPSATSDWQRVDAERQKDEGDEGVLVSGIPGHCLDDESTPQSTTPSDQAAAARPPSQAGTVKQDTPAKESRADVKSELFQALARGAQTLVSSRLRPFAEGTGFQGTDEEWDQEYTLLCTESGCDPTVGMDEATWSRLVDDESDGGCYCTDEELQSLRAEVQKTAPSAAPVFDPQTASREELKAAVFKHFATGPRLLSKELRRFAECTGFDGTDDMWAEEYALVCREAACALDEGLDQTGFETMVDDDSDNGCYCSDEELRSMLLSSLAAAQPPGQPAAAADSAARQPGETPQDNRRPATATSASADPPASSQPAVVSKGKGRGRGVKGAGKAAGARPLAPPPAAQPPGAGGDGDPWSSGAAFDPWSTPAAQRASAETKRRVEAKAAEAAQVWTDWQDAGRPGADADFSSKPALNAQRLLEASQAALAARQAAKEAEEAAEAARRAAQEDAFWDSPGPDGAAAACSSAAPHQVPKAVSMPAALHSIGACLARAALGEPRGASDLLDAVLSAPVLMHGLAVASSALRLLLQGRAMESRTLLAVDEMMVHPVDGDSTLLYALGILSRGLGRAGAPLLVRCLQAAMVKVEDKKPAVRDTATSVTEDIVRSTDPFAFDVLLPALLGGLDPKRGRTTKLHAFKLIRICCRGCDRQLAVAQRLPQLLPVVADLMADTLTDVRGAAAEAASDLMELCGNRDLRPHIDTVVSCAKGGHDVTKCVQDLAEVVFVQQVDAPALAVVMPVLTKGLRSRNLRTQRQASLIAENMCRLVSAVADVQAFVPQLLPLLGRTRDEASDPDVRAVAGRAHAGLASVAEANAAGAVKEQLVSVLARAESAVAADSSEFTPCPGPVREVLRNYVVQMVLGLARSPRHDESSWKEPLAPLLGPLVGHGGDEVDCVVYELFEAATPLRAEALKAAHCGGTPDELADVAIEGLLCRCRITLACGAATLLSDAELKLEHSGIYGLVGANDSGKSTLLRALHDRRVAGLPDIATALVEHGLGEKPPASEQTPVDFLMADSTIRALDWGRSEVTKELENLGFGDAGRMRTQIKKLSGGWRMKLSLARAILQDADLLLLDEPTGHLDAEHIEWMVEYVKGLGRDREKQITTLVVSHDAEFLDRVCTHIIHVADGTLRTYSGDFSSFLEAVPDAKLGHASLTQPQADGAAVSSSDTPIAFTLPEPGTLPGLKSRGRRLLHVEDASYTYPGSNIAAVRSASVECSLKSRVAIIGPNGAGKSTVAALVVGELAPQTGSAWRHPNLRVAYVAQHAFHHLEQHADLSATEYFLWRFVGNQDQEALDFRAEEAECENPRTYRLTAGGRLEQCESESPDVVEVEVIIDRRQRGRLGYEYEVRWRGNSETAWLSRLQLAAMGYLGMVKREDERQAAAAALSARPLTTPAIEAHLAGFGLGAEEASHRRLSALSNGQRARVVLGAATWLAPHLLVLDEPTNYLDRPALAALTASLRTFGGGVLVISHTMAFVDDVCTERWVMRQGLLRREGSSFGEEEPAVLVSAAAAAVAAAKELKEKKRLKRIKELRRKNGEDVSDDDADWWEDLLKKTNGKLGKA